MPGLWNKYEPLLDPRQYLWPDAVCFWARDYLSRQGYSGGYANQLIHNFKRSPRFKGQAPWGYRCQAVRQFAQELSTVIPQRSTVTYIPSKNHPENPEYDNRFEDLFVELHRMRPDLGLFRYFDFDAGQLPAHSGGSRDPMVLEAALKLKLPVVSETVVLVDDVLTSGGHYTACKRKLQASKPSVHVVGYFWTKAKSPPQDGPTIFDGATYIPDEPPTEPLGAF